MRITTQMRRSQMLYDLERLQTNLFQAQNVLTDGREVSKGSDDPVRAQKALIVRSSLARREQYMDNLQHGMSRLSMAEATLMNVDDLLSEARATAIQFANDASIPEDRVAAAESVNSLLEELLSESNSRDDGAYIFGGYNTEDAPFEAVRDSDTGEITSVIARPEYMEGEITVKADEDLEIQVNMNGNEIFQTGTPGDSEDMFQALIDLRDGLREEDDEVGQSLIEQAIGILDTGLTRTQTSLTDLGGRYNRLQSVEQNHMNIEYREEEELSNAEDADLTEWITRFELQSIALQQAMAVGTQVLNASIVNFIR